MPSWTAWARASTATSRTFVLRGPPGAGARRLAAELAQLVSRQGAPVEHLTAAADHMAALESATLTVVDACCVGRRPPRTSPARTGPRLVLVLHAPPRAALPTRSTLPASRDEDAVREVLASYLPTAASTDSTTTPSATSCAPPRRARPGPRGGTGRGPRVGPASAWGSGANAPPASTTALTEARESLVEGVEEYRTQSEKAVPVDPDVCPWKGLRRLRGPRRAVVRGAGAAGGRAPGQARVRPAPGRRRSVGQRQVVLGARGPAGVAGVRGSPGQRGLDAAGDAARASSPARAARVALRGRDSNRDEVADLLERLVARRRDGDAGTVLVVDQLEEVWTTCTDPAERRRSSMRCPTSWSPGLAPCRLVLAVRADYLGRAGRPPRPHRCDGRRHRAGRGTDRGRGAPRGRATRRARRARPRHRARGRHRRGRRAGARAAARCSPPPWPSCGSSARAAG